MSNDAASDAVDFSGLKKKSKKTSSSSTAVPATDASPAATDDALDFSDLKKKKRKKTVRLDLSDDEQDSTELKSRVDAFGNEIIEEAPVAPTATASATATTDENGAAVTGGDEFADLKKKKRSGKKTNFDLEAFEAELAASSVDPASSNATSNDGTPAGSDGEDNGENDVGEGEDPFKISKDNGEEGDDVVLSKAEQAAEDKDWLKEGQTTRDYAYTEVNARFLLFSCLVTERTALLTLFCVSYSYSVDSTLCFTRLIPRSLQPESRRGTLSPLLRCIEKVTSDRSLRTFPTFARRCIDRPSTLFNFCLPNWERMEVWMEVVD